MKKIEENYYRVVDDQLGKGPEEATPDKKFVEDLGADSLDLIELIMAMEEEFNTEITDEEAESITTVGEGLKLLKKKLG